MWHGPDGKELEGALAERLADSSAHILQILSYRSRFAMERAWSGGLARSLAPASQT
jgi:hypothetical protein